MTISSMATRSLAAMLLAGAVAGPARADAATGKGPDTLVVAMTLAMKRYCDHSIPGFEAEVSTDWSRWRARHAAQIREIETYARRPASPREPPDRFGNFRREDARFVCTPAWVRDLVAEPHEKSTRFATSPEATWRRLMEAFARADRKAALDCYSPGSRVQVGRDLEQLSDEDIKRFAATWQLVGAPAGDKSRREYAIQHGKERAGTIQFEDFEGSWLIVER